MDNGQSEAAMLMGNPNPYRLLSNLSMPAYKGASTAFKQELRDIAGGDADYLTRYEQLILIARSRALSRNNGYASGAESKLTNRLGSIRVQWQDANGNPHDKMQAKWDAFAKNPNTDGFGDLNTTQATWLHERFQAGEAIARMVIAPTDYEVPLKLQTIESEYLDITYMGWDDPKFATPYGITRYGITFGGVAGDTPQWYHFWTLGKYGQYVQGENTWKRNPIPAEDILHMFERRRARQWRGVPALSPVINTLYKLIDLADATANMQTAASAIAWIVETPDIAAMNAPGTAKISGENYIGDAHKKIYFQNEGGSVQYLSPGEKMIPVQSTDIGNNLGDFMRKLLEEVSTGLDIPYHVLTNDTDRLDFSAIQGVLLEFRNRLEFLHHFVTIPNGIQKLTARFKELAVVFDASIADAVPVYILPKHLTIDPLKDKQATLLGIQMGLIDYTQELERAGLTPEQAEASRALLKRLGLNGLLDVQSPAKDPSSNNKAAKSDSSGT